jgi:hypothetical protein
MAWFRQKCFSAIIYMYIKYLNFFTMCVVLSTLEDKTKNRIEKKGFRAENEGENCPELCPLFWRNK